MQRMDNLHCPLEGDRHALQSKLYLYGLLPHMTAGKGGIFTVSLFYLRLQVTAARI